MAEKRKVYIFSKHLHWLDYTSMADFIAECGFDGVDITVRKDGHVESERVEDDLPRAVEALKKVGKDVAMITTSILRDDEPHTEKIIKTAGALGVLYYRPGWHNYDPKLTIDENLKEFEKQLRGLVRLNEKYKIRASYQNHAGTSLGSSVWDLGQLLRHVNSPFIGCQYDVRHATVEGGHSWPLGFEYVKPYINSLDIKDFQWRKENGKWITQNVPLGEGMVDFDRYFKLISSLPSSVPMCLHMEYPLGGAEHGHKKITMKPDEVKSAMQKELAFLKDKI
jgi:sugar phosphate isomerase/epimerase